MLRPRHNSGSIRRDLVHRPEPRRRARFPALWCLLHLNDVLHGGGELRNGLAGTDETLAESWDGARWSIVPSPDDVPAPHSSTLNAVSCTSPTFCMAVGPSVTGTGASETLVERWDGTRWSIVPSPNEEDTSLRIDQLLGVSCVSANSCSAVGSFGPARAEIALTLVERWDGTQWAVVPSPTPNAGPSNGYNDVLTGVPCASVNSCTAVGYLQTSGTSKTLVESWDGARWSVVRSPNEGPASDRFEALRAVS